MITLPRIARILLAGADLLLIPSVCFADNCGSLADCYPNALAAAAVAAAILTLAFGLPLIIQAVAGWLAGTAVATTEAELVVGVDTVARATAIAEEVAGRSKGQSGGAKQKHSVGINELVDKIRRAGPKGKALVQSLDKATTRTRMFVGTRAETKDGSVIPLSNTGGGITLRPTESKSGVIEIYVDPSNLINYKAVDGSTVQETPEGLLLHEMGHAKLLNSNDPAQTSGGPDAEKNVRHETNPVREELGMKPEK